MYDRRSVTEGVLFCNDALFRDRDIHVRRDLEAVFRISGAHLIINLAQPILRFDIKTQHHIKPDRFLRFIEVEPVALHDPGVSGKALPDIVPDPLRLNRQVEPYPADLWACVYREA